MSIDVKRRRELAAQAVALALQDLHAMECFEPVSERPAEQQAFWDPELASLVEIHLGVQLDTHELDDEARSLWSARVQIPFPSSDPPSPNSFWLRDARQRIGTLSCRPMPHYVLPRIDLMSLYVRPAHRRRGHAYDLLRTVADVAHAAGVDEVRVQTNWCRPDAARLYMKLGMWVRGWKRDLDFCFARRLPRWHVQFLGDTAIFSIGEDHTVLVRAERRGDRLGWVELPALAADVEDEFAYLVPGTFALALALQGWPLLRDEEAWRAELQRRGSDIGGPEALAYKIIHYEAWAHEHGWQVTSPRIPGLPYSSWSELNDRRAT